MKHYPLLLLFFLAASCQIGGNSEMEGLAPNHTSQLQLLEASSDEKTKFSAWMTSDNPNARVSMDYDPDRLVSISSASHNRMAVTNTRDPNTSLSFVVDPVTNTIERAMISTSIRNSDNSITSRAYNIQNQLMFEVIHRPNGSLDFIYVDQMATSGFWKEWDKCLGTIAAPFESNIANIAFDAIASGATYGMWLPAVGLVCLGVAGGLNYQNNQRR